MPLLPGRDMNIRALGIRMGLQLSRPRRVVMHLDLVQGQAGEVFDTRFQPIRQAGTVGARGREGAPARTGKRRSPLNHGRFGPHHRWQGRLAGFERIFSGGLIYHPQPIGRRGDSDALRTGRGLLVGGVGRLASCFVACCLIFHRLRSFFNSEW